MTNPDELERASRRRLTERVDVDAENPVILVVREDLRLILSANREMRAALAEGRSWLNYAIHEEWTPDSHALACHTLDRIDAALTTQRGDGE